MKPFLRRVHGQLSYVIGTDTLELSVTKRGGHMAPVTFYRTSAAPFQPYYVSPWQDERAVIEEPVLRPLRGDFFCMPFGGNNTIGNEKHVVHGETATAEWQFNEMKTSGGTTELVLNMNTIVRPGSVTKRLLINDKQNVVYIQHVLEGFAGPMCLGHHATLAVGAEKDSLRFSSSPIRFGYTSPSAPGPYAADEYYCLPPAARFKDLSSVPTIWKDRPFTDRTSFPAEEGFTDILAIFPKSKSSPAWNAAVFPRQGYAWFALRDPRVLPSTVLWTANKGRRHAPWDGRNRCLGIEDVCAFFAEGLRDSARQNFLSELGIPTSIGLSPAKPLVINYIQGAVKVPRSFDRVASMEFGPDVITLTSTSGATVNASVNHSFLSSGALA